MCSRCVSKRKIPHVPTRLMHEMQVFVANPKKPPQIEAILRRNQEKLLIFLKGFHNDKDGTSFFLV